MSFFINYKTIPSKNSYFAALNTHEGFVSYYENAFFSSERLYIIKGGPGTGKSSFMKKVAHLAEQKGVPVDYYHCSSDPDSIDGIVIGNNKIAIIDGTAPHTQDPKYPGVKEEIINLGEYWNAKKLGESKSDIICLTDRIKKLYSYFYRLLRSYTEVDIIIDDICENAVLERKMTNQIERMISGFRRGNKPEIYIKNTASFGTKGAVCFDTQKEISHTLFSVNDYHNISSVYFLKLSDMLQKRNIPFEVGFLPLTGKIHYIRLPVEDICFINEKDSRDVKTINMQRFCDKEKIRACKNRLRALTKIKKDIFMQANSCASEIGNLHNKLEGYYISAMDFEKTDERAEKLFKEISNQL